MSMVELAGRSKPAAVVSPEQTHPAINHARVVTDDEGAWLYVTDSYRYARVPLVAEEPPPDGWVPQRALEAIEENGGRFTLTDEHVIHADADSGAEVRYKRPEPSAFLGDKQPWWEKVDGQYDPPTGDDRLVISLNAAFLAEVAAALGAKNNAVRIVVDLAKFTTEAGVGRVYLKPLIVEADASPGATDGREPRALLMPVRPS